MIDYVTILSLLSEASRGFFKTAKREKARKKGCEYICSKYGLEVGYQLRTTSQFAYSVRTYSNAWEAVLYELLTDIVDARKIEVDLCEKAGDAYIIIDIVQGSDKNADAPGSWLGVLKYRGDEGIFANYRYLNSFAESETFVSLYDLARGRLTEVGLQVLQREITAWCSRNNIDLSTYK